MGGKTPDLTPAQIVAAVGGIAAQLLNAALITGQTEHLIVGIAGIVIPLGWVLADAVIRHGRAQVKAAEVMTAAAATSRPLAAELASTRSVTIDEAATAVANAARNAPSMVVAYPSGEEWGPPPSRPQARKQEHPILQAYGTFDGLALGKQPPVHDPRTLMLGEYLALAPASESKGTLRLPKLPKRVHRLDAIAAAIGGDFGMMGNAAYGDCTCAALGHLEQGWTAGNTDTETFTPTEDQVLDLYWKTGSPPTPGMDDHGRVMFSVLKYAKNQGLFGRKIGAYVSVGLHRWRHRDIKAAIDLFGGCYLGVALPRTAQSQAVWDVAGDPSASGPAQRYSWGGHAISLHDYDEVGPTCVTWGHPQKMTWAFIDAYADEAYAIVADDWLAGGKTIEGFDAVMLAADLDRIRQGWQPPQ